MNVLSTTWRALALFAPFSLVAVVAVHLVPRARGIAFPLELRFSLVVPLCAALALVAAWGYPRLAARHPHPRRALSMLVLIIAGLFAALALVVGGAHLAISATPALVVVGLTAWWLVPRFAARPPRRLGAAAIALLGALEIALVFVAIGGERSLPRGPGGGAFEVPRDLFDVEHRYLELSGVRVHYVDEGTGPTLLFLHGNPAWSFQWRDLIAGLRGSFRCVALDYPGFGLSDSPPGHDYSPRAQSAVVEELVDHLALRDITLVMHDWGGPIGLGFAGRRPELVRALVLGNTWAWPTSTAEPRGKFSMVVGGPLGELVQVSFNAFPGAALDRGVVRALPDEVAALYVRPFLPLERRGIAIYYPAQITEANPWLGEVEAGLARLADRPALIFWGMRDPGMPRADLARFERAFPHHETHELDADHFFFEDFGEQLVASIRGFAASEAPPTSP